MKFIPSFRVKVYKHYKTVYDYDLNVSRYNERILKCSVHTLSGKLNC